MTALYWLHITLALISRFGISALFAVLYVYTGELFPTVIRSIVMGTVSIGARIGSIISPYLYDIVSTILIPISNSLPHPRSSLIYIYIYIYILQSFFHARDLFFFSWHNTNKHSVNKNPFWYFRKSLLQDIIDMIHRKKVCINISWYFKKSVKKIWLTNKIS